VKKNRKKNEGVDKGVDEGIKRWRRVVKGEGYLACMSCGHVFKKFHPSFNNCTECLCSRCIPIEAIYKPKGKKVWYAGVSRLFEVVKRQHTNWDTYGIKGFYDARTVSNKIKKYMEVLYE